MSSTGRGCQPQPPLPGNAAPSALPGLDPAFSQLACDIDVPAVMLFPDWRSLADLAYSTTPSSVEVPEQLITDEDSAARLLIPGVLYVLPLLSSTPLPAKRVEGNATWG